MNLSSMIVALLSATLANIVIMPNLLAQSIKENPHNREKLGSSLKRLKWDSKKRVAVESNEQKNTQNRITQAGTDEAIKLETLLITFNLLVTDYKGQRVITGLNKDDFILTEDGVKQQVAICAPGDDPRLSRSIVLLIEFGIDQALYIESSLKAAETLINHLAPTDEMAIVTSQMELLIDFTNDKKILLTAIQKLRNRTTIGKPGKFQMYRGLPFKHRPFTTLFAVVRELVNTERNRSIIIFQTSGAEAAALRDQPTAERLLQQKLWEPYNFGIGDIYTAIEKSPATIYTVLSAERIIGLPPAEALEKTKHIIDEHLSTVFRTEEEFRSYVKRFPLSDEEYRFRVDLGTISQTAAVRVATLSGGWAAFLESPEHAETIYSQILTDISQRYSIGYYPTNSTRGGQLRSVKIEVRGHPEYIVHGRRSYYAPGEKKKS